jgi:hypothetical protein
LVIAWVEPPEPGWGPLAKLATSLRRLGYTVESSGIGDTWRLLLS